MALSDHRRCAKSDRRARQAEGEGAEGERGLRLHCEGEGEALTGEASVSNEAECGGAKSTSNVHKIGFHTFHVVAHKDQAAGLLLLR